jgi:hypothetical protein
MLVEEAAEPAIGDGRVAPVMLELDRARLRAGQGQQRPADGDAAARTRAGRGAEALWQLASGRKMQVA